MMLHNEPAWLSEKRQAAKEQFEQLPLPKEDRRTSFHTVSFEHELAPATVTIDASGSVTALPFSDALDHPLLEKYLGSTLFSPTKFSAFADANFQDGVFIHVPEGADAHITIAKHNPSATRTLIILDKMARATVTETIEGTTVFSSEIVEIILNEGSSLQYANAQDTQGDVRLVTRRAIIEKDAHLSWSDVCFGAALVAADIQSVMRGSGARTNAYTVFYGREAQHFDLKNVAIHAAPSTQSQMLAKGALDGRAKQVYRGLIRIEKNAANSLGHQKEDTLMLSSHAETDPIPMLQIENNDVRCTHAATISHVDQSKMFYIQSRGVSAQEAREMVIEAFFTPFLTNLPKNVQEWTGAKVRTFL